MEKLMGFIFSMCLTLGVLLTPNMAYAEESEIGIAKTYVTITDTTTGNVVQYEVDAADTVITENSEGEKIIEKTFEIDNIPGSIPFTDQMVTDDLYGYKGTVRISYTDDGTYANLKEVYARWQRTSGNNSIQNITLNYGQALGTNSRQGYRQLSGTAIQLQTGWPAGKYGNGGYLGATLNATIGSYQVAVQSNVNF